MHVRDADHFQVLRQLDQDAYAIERELRIARAELEVGLVVRPGFSLVFCGRIPVFGRRIRRYVYDSCSVFRFAKFTVCVSHA